MLEAIISFQHTGAFLHLPRPGDSLSDPERGAAKGAAWLELVPLPVCLLSLALGLCIGLDAAQGFTG